VTENGFGKRTSVSEYPKKGRGTMGVLTIRYNEARGRLAGAMIMRDGWGVMLISQDGTVIRQKADGISRMSRNTQGVRVMNLREGDRLSSIARVTEPTGDEGDEGDEVPATDGAAPEVEGSDETPSPDGAAE
jgi:DNA gyrase subunit A